MKKANSIIIATIIATFVFSIFAFQPTTEASNNAMPSATPPKRKLPRPIQSPKPSSSSIRRTNTPKGVIESIGTKYIKRKQIPSTESLNRTRQPRRKRGIPAPTPSPTN